MPVMAVSKFERFFRAAAEVDVDKDDLKRFSDFVGDQLVDLLIMGEATAKANGRDVIEPWDLPVTKGLQESTHHFEKLDEGLDLEPILEQLVGWPQLDRPPNEDTQARLPGLVGGMSLALARTFRIIDPKLRNPSSEHWEKAFQIFDMLL
jgi:hypothetical protein